VVARSLPLQVGDEVLATDHEYGALDRTWRFVCQKRGGRYVNQTLNLPVETREQVVEVIITSWRDLQLIRVSVQAYNSQSDLDRLDAALSTLLPQLKRW
jgi:selenocysteine lyase/cysteine desulfurase